jgi:hypothetical protein
MYCRDPAVLARLSRRLRWYRGIVNSVPVIIICGFALAFISCGDHSCHKGLGVLDLLWVVPLVLAAFFLGLPAVVLSGLFRSGTLKCPCCGQPFTGFWTLMIPKECASCGFNLVSEHRKGDF